MTAPLLDLVAVAYQAPTETANFLASLVHVDVPFRLTVIDNASPDEAVRDVIRRVMPKGTKDGPGNCRASMFVASKQNVGYAKAINEGLSFYKDPAPYAAILNADVEFLPSQSMSHIIRQFEENPDVGVIGPRTIDSTGRVTHGGIVNTHDNPRNHHRAWMQQDSRFIQDIMDVNTVSGATYFVRRTMWDELTACEPYRDYVAGMFAAPPLGAFLPTKHFFEETFCSYHARKHGWRVQYLGTVAMIHQWHRSSTVGSQSFDVPRRQFMEACEALEIDMTGEIE